MGAVTLRIAINGYGRIGRLVHRIIAERDKNVEVVAVNDLVPADNLSYLLKHDSIHRTPKLQISSEEDAIVVNGKKTLVLSEKEPLNLPWKALAVDYVVEATGLFTHADGALKHIQAGAQHVIITAPAKGAIPTFVMGVNHERFNPAKDYVVSNASCTTNCLAPLTKVLLDNFGIEEGLMTTVHSLTASQPTVDGPSKKDWRGGRAASINIIPSSTGAAKAVGLCLPEVAGKLTGMAFRIPTTNVSVVDLTVRLSQETTYEAICGAVQKAAQSGPMQGIIHYCDEEVVSTDFMGSDYSCIFDKGAGIALNSRFYKLIAWYDNEWGYAHRVIDLLIYMANQKNNS